MSITRPEPTEGPADLASHTIVIILISETISAYSAVFSLTGRVGDGGTRCGSPQLSPPVKLSCLIKRELQYNLWSWGSWQMPNYQDTRLLHCFPGNLWEISRNPYISSSGKVTTKVTFHFFGSQTCTWFICGGVETLTLITWQNWTWVPHELSTFVAIWGATAEAFLHLSDTKPLRPPNPRRWISSISEIFHSLLTHSCGHFNVPVLRLYRPQTQHICCLQLGLSDCQERCLKQACDAQFMGPHICDWAPSTESCNFIKDLSGQPIRAPIMGTSSFFFFLSRNIFCLAQLVAEVTGQDYFSISSAASWFNSQWHVTDNSVAAPLFQVFPPRIQQICQQPWS